MSAIDKKPFIIKALETLSVSDLETLKNLINGGVSNELSGGNFRSLINPEHYITENDTGIHEITLEISRNRAQNLYKGYLVYNIIDENEYYCFLIYYSTPDQQTIGIVKVELNNPHSTYSFCNPLTILELRSEINDALAGEGESSDIPTPTSEDNGKVLGVSSGAYALLNYVPDKVSYQTTAPTQANTDGLKFVVLSEEPATKYDGYIYIITESAQTGYSVTVSYNGPYSTTVYDGQDNAGTELVTLSGGDSETVICSSGYLYFYIVGSGSLEGSNGATTANPSTITANGASIVITAAGGYND